MPRKAPRKEETVSIRITPEMAAAIDEVASRIRHAAPAWAVVSRAEALRQLIAAGLAAMRTPQP